MGLDVPYGSWEKRIPVDLDRAAIRSLTIAKRTPKRTGISARSLGGNRALLRAAFSPSYPRGNDVYELEEESEVVGAHGD